MSSIYAMGDPRTQQVHYVGKAKNVYRRFAQHLIAPHHNEQKDAWMDDIKAAGIAPFLITLETDVDVSMENERERYWIEYYLALGAPLTNIAHGPCASVEVSTDYISAHDAAQILSAKHHRPVRPDYISKMAASRKHSIRIARFRDRLMYHRADIEAATIRQRQVRNLV